MHSFMNTRTVPAPRVERLPVFADPPRFDLLLTTAPVILMGQDITGTVRARSVVFLFILIREVVTLTHR